jgi:hypothetical protein
MISGNTDCKMYYNLSKHVYREDPVEEEEALYVPHARLKGKSG